MTGEWISNGWTIAYINGVTITIVYNILCSKTVNFELFIASLYRCVPNTYVITKIVSCFAHVASIIWNCFLNFLRPVFFISLDTTVSRPKAVIIAVTIKARVFQFTTRKLLGWSRNVKV